MNIGITGHQRLEKPEAWSWVELAIRRELDQAAQPLTLITSLAIGADQLGARLALNRGAAIKAILPFEDIERTFSEPDLAAYHRLIKHASVEILCTAGTDEDAYLAAGKRVVELSDLLIAIWDGESAKGRGGTADVVSYALSIGVRVVHVDPIRKIVTKLSRPPADPSIGCDR
jgi:hypothetical protein